MYRHYRDVHSIDEAIVAMARHGQEHLHRQQRLLALARAARSADKSLVWVVLKWLGARLPVRLRVRFVHPQPAPPSQLST